MNKFFEKMSAQEAMAHDGVSELVLITKPDWTVRQSTAEKPGWVITDENKFKDAARRALNSCGSALNVYMAVQWAQSEDLRIDQYYQVKIEEAAK